MISQPVALWILWLSTYVTIIKMSFNFVINGILGDLIDSGDLLLYMPMQYLCRHYYVSWLNSSVSYCDTFCQPSDSASHKFRVVSLKVSCWTIALWEKIESNSNLIWLRRQSTLLKLEFSIRMDAFVNFWRKCHQREMLGIFLILIFFRW